MSDHKRDIHSTEITSRFRVGLKSKQLPARQYHSWKDDLIYTIPSTSLTSRPIWEFGTGDFEAVPTSCPTYIKLTILYEDYCNTYRHSRISDKDFRKALFCLAGMVKAGLVPFVPEFKDKFATFLRVPPSPFSPRFLDPLATISGWTVDCFVERFRDFERTFRGTGYSCWPSPITWVEAELDDEVQEGRIRQPFSLATRTNYDLSNSSVIDWEILKSLKFQIRKERGKGSIAKYPMPFTPVVSNYLCYKYVR